MTEHVRVQHPNQSLAGGSQLMWHLPQQITRHHAEARTILL